MANFHFKNMEHPYRDWIRTKFGEYVGTGPLARNCERNILNWTVKKVPLSEATWESKLFCLTYKRKAIWLLTEFKRRSMVKVKLSVEGGEVKVKLVLVSQLADRLKKRNSSQQNSRGILQIYWTQKVHILQ